MVDIECVAEVGDILGEGPIWNVAEQALYWVDAYGQAIRRYAPEDGSVDSWKMPELIGSLVFREPGGIVAGMKSGFRFVDLESGSFETIADPQPGSNILLNDGKCDRRGRYWCGTIEMSLSRPEGMLWRLDPDLTCHCMDTGITVSNGIAWSPDDTVMYFADTRADTVYAYDFDIETGAIANRRVFLSTRDMPGRVDGATVDTEGYYWCALIHDGHIARYAPDGRLDRRIDLPVRHPTMCTFGGAGFEDLYVTSATRFITAETKAKQPQAGALFVIRGLGVRGLPEPLFAG